jgi:hypothetical protein
LAFHTDEIITKLSLKKCVPIKKKLNVDFSYAATDMDMDLRWEFSPIQGSLFQGELKEI